MFWRELSAVEVVALAASGVAVIGIGLALLTPAGRSAFAAFGLRIADALTCWLEAQLSVEARHARNAERH
jgi:hypothetical protein